MKPATFRAIQAASRDYHRPEVARQMKELARSLLPVPRGRPSPTASPLPISRIRWERLVAEANDEGRTDQSHGCRG